MKTLKDFEVDGKRVLVRTGFDVPVDEKGNVTDDERIKDGLPTIQYLLEHKAKIIIMCHMGRPDGKVVENLKMDGVARRLEKLTKKKVTKLDACVGDAVKEKVNQMNPGDIIILENLRFFDAEKSKDQKVRLAFAKQLAELGELYVNDAFSNCHRDHASMTGIPKYLPSCAGLLVEKEVTYLMEKINNPQRPFVVIAGGTKGDKLNAIQVLAKKADKVLMAGALASYFLKVQGKFHGEVKIDLEGVDNADKVIKNLLGNDRIVLPSDGVFADRFDKKAKIKKGTIEQAPAGWMALDIGKETIKRYKEILKSAKMVVWFGPIGVFEWNHFRKGTKEIAKFIAKLDADKVIGGGDSGNAVNSLHLGKKMTWISTGGGASMELFEGKELVAIKALG